MPHETLGDEMAEFDLVIRGGTVVTAADTFRADVGVRNGRVAALGEKLDGAQTLDAGGLLVMPDPSDTVVRDEIPEVVASGVRSLKVFLTYEPSHLDDREFLRVLAAARRTGALVTVHCENYEAIRWRTEALLADGSSAPKYH